MKSFLSLPLSLGSRGRDTWRKKRNPLLCVPAEISDWLAWSGSLHMLLTPTPCLPLPFPPDSLYLLSRVFHVSCLRGLPFTLSLQEPFCLIALILSLLLSLLCSKQLTAAPPTDLRSQQWCGSACPYCLVNIGNGSVLNEGCWRSALMCWNQRGDSFLWPYMLNFCQTGWTD